jgi:peptidoglycan/xylan/chitin deacetylase (PgdA/CDA1 family)
LKLALKIDVDTYRGTREGVPRLMDVLARHGAGATFLFSLGPDHTGRAIRRALRPGFMKKVSRTSVLEHYGLKTLLYGTVLPGPDIGRLCADVMLEVQRAGYETGVHCWDHVRWQDGVEQADEAWTRAELERACARFHEVLRQAPRVHGAAGWQMNVHAFRLAERLGFEYASDTRGTCAFIPVWNGEPFSRPQLPTTLPTLDELIGLAGVDAGNVASKLLELTTDGRDHVYTLHAELEGGRLAPAFEAALLGWRGQGYELVALRELATGLDLKTLPRHSVVRGEVPGRSGTLMIQGPEFLR